MYPKYRKQQRFPFFFFACRLFLGVHRTYLSTHIASSYHIAFKYSNALIFSMCCFFLHLPPIPTPTPPHHSGHHRYVTYPHHSILPEILRSTDAPMGWICTSGVHTHGVLVGSHNQNCSGPLLLRSIFFHIEMTTSTFYVIHIEIQQLVPGGPDCPHQHPTTALCSAASPMQLRLRCGE